MYARATVAHRQARLRWGALPGAVLLSLVLAGQSVAATWAAPFALTAWPSSVAGDLVTLGSSAAVAVYAEHPADFVGPSSVFARRTTDSGASWAAPTLLSTDGSFPAVAGYGSSVDVVWNKGNGRIRYARSTDGGATFGSSIALSPLGRYAWRPSVARGPDGVVAVVWEDVQSGAVRVRVSTNGGAAFGAARTLATAGDELGVAAAVGRGVIYIAYHVGSDGLRVRRSIDAGATWGGAAVISNASTGEGIDITAAGHAAYVAYTVPNAAPNFSRIRYRATSNSGASWSSQRNLSPLTWTTAYPQIELKGGVLRASFLRCTPEFDICVDNRVLYRQSANGVSWAAAERVSPTSLWDAYPAGIGFAGKILALYTGIGPSGDQPFVRAGTP